MQLFNDCRCASQENKYQANCKEGQAGQWVQGIS